MESTKMVIQDKSRSENLQAMKKYLREDKAIPIRVRVTRVDEIENSKCAIKSQY
jgi:hypothetical protein